MTTDPEQLRAEIQALLAGLPDITAADSDLDGDEPLARRAEDIEAVAARLEAAHDVLVRALYSVETDSVETDSVGMDSVETDERGPASTR
jgi:hypothetical protein